MKVLIGFECSGRSREAFRKLGHDAWSCDLLPAKDESPYHLQGDVFKVLEGGLDWDLAVFHPTCTYLCSSGLHWNKRVEGRQEKTDAALNDIRRLMRCGIPSIAIENPIGCISTKIRKPDQIIQPYMFGDDASKATCLWLQNLQPLVVPPEEEWFPPRLVTYKGKEAKRWSNQTDSGENKLGPSKTRWLERSMTYPGIATAFAENWGTET